MATNEVTERDIRLPEFRDAKLEDLEFRADGKVVRKDRWETAIYKIRDLLGDRRREFEIVDVVGAVRALVNSLPAPIDVDDTEDITAKVFSKD